MKKLLVFVLTTLMIMCFVGCGKNNNATNSSPSDASDTISLPNKIVTIGNTTVEKIAEKLSKTELGNNLKLSVKNDALDTEFSSISYAIVNSDNKNLAEISLFSDLENKASMFTVSWEYKDNSKETNEQLLTATKALLPAVWPEYNQSNFEALERNFKLTTDYIDRFINTNTSESAPASGDSGFIALGTSSGTVTFTIRYPNVVENI